MFSFVCSLFLIEQIAIYFPGSFPYRFGVPISQKSFPSDKYESQELKSKSLSGFIIKKVKKAKSEDIYLRYKYPPLVIGPILFVGQICCGQKNKVLIRAAPLSTIFICFLALSPLIQDDGFSILNSFGILLLVFLFYYRFLRNYQKTIQHIEFEKQF